jgi:NAD(P)-dependent dehydrogenase (short-subunit alcohol dehydrogenase family)
MTHTSTAGAVIVTGASRGLGRGIATAFAAGGFPTVLVARDRAALDELAATLPGETFVRDADVRDARALEALAHDVAGRYGSIAAIVNAAGAPAVTAAPDELTWQQWRTPIDVDVHGVFALTRAAAPFLAGGATIVNVASGAVAAASALHVSYSPGQAAVLSLSRCLGAWLAPRGVVTHCVCPEITGAGGVGREAMEVFGAREGVTGAEWFARRYGDRVLTPETAGAAVLGLLAVREGGDWQLGAEGVRRWFPLSAPVREPAAPTPARA